MNKILFLHHYISIFILFLFIFIIIYFLYKKNKLNSLCKKLSLLLVFSLHIQACFGLILLYKKYLLINNFSLYDIMNINELRYKLIEHPLIMLLVVIITTLLNINLKRKNTINYKIIFIYILIFIILINRMPIKTLFF